MTTGGRKWLPLICGLLFGAMTTHFAHLATTMLESAPRSQSFNKPTRVQVEAEKTLRESTTFSLTLKQNQRSVELDVPAQLHKRIRILCLITTHPRNYATSATAVNNTWASRCNRHVFVGSESTNLSLPLMRLNITEHHDNLWQKTWMSLDYAEKNFDLSQFDFVLKADDDTYVVMENLRLILLPLDPRKPSFIGRKFRYNGDSNKPYMSGGAGYVLSRSALEKFVKIAVRNPKSDPCRRQLRHSEDFMLGSCLNGLGVQFIDSRDSEGLERFHPLSPGYMIGWGPLRMPEWMDRFNYFKFKACLRGCISRASATFHYIATTEMYKMEFLLYGMGPIGFQPVAMETSRTMELLSYKKLP